MPASKASNPSDPELQLPPMSSMHCPYCGHTSPYHVEKGCTACTCTVSWVDIVRIHVGLYSSP